MTSVQESSHPSLNPIPLKYSFSTQVDRDFTNGRYGTGVRLYIPDGYIIITGVSYDPEKNQLIVKSRNSRIILTDEPNIDLFRSTLQKDWKEWDTKYGVHDEDRTDYEPWCHASLKALAKELGVNDGFDGQMYVDKSF
jgi:hypothetical protein